LEVTQDAVEVEVLREPSRGVLGIGARDALVRLTLSQPQEPPPAPPEPEAAVEVEAEDAQEIVQRPTTDEETLALAEEVLTELLEKMSIPATIEARVVKPSYPGDEPSLMLDIEGKDLSFLIGRRGETLAAVQHLVRLIVNKATQKRSNLVVDVEGYKVRRERALKKLALRIADQATRRNRRIALEPMNAYERRIIHMTLRNHPTVTTESVGERNRRKVTILPKDQA
jgi:spoIIIJ-associated protein